MLHKLPPARELIGDRGCDSSRFRGELAERGIAACIPSTRSGKRPNPHDAVLYRQRHRIAMRYDRCAHTFFSAITLAATVIFWLAQ